MKPQPKAHHTASLFTVTYYLHCIAGPPLQWAGRLRGSYVNFDTRGGSKPALRGIMGVRYSLIRPSVRTGAPSPRGKALLGK